MCCKHVASALPHLINKTYIWEQYCIDHSADTEDTGSRRHALFPGFEWLPSGRRLRCPTCRSQKRTFIARAALLLSSLPSLLPWSRTVHPSHPLILHLFYVIFLIYLFNFIFPHLFSLIHIAIIVLTVHVSWFAPRGYYLFQLHCQVEHSPNMDSSQCAGLPGNSRWRHRHQFWW